MLHFLETQRVEENSEAETGLKKETKTVEAEERWLFGNM